MKFVSVRTGMKREEQQAMESFMDKLCDHMPMERIKLLVDNGFDEWGTVTYMKGDQLIELGFDAQQCIVIMVAANANALENQQTQIFPEPLMKQIIAAANSKAQERECQVLKQQAEHKLNASKQGGQLKQASLKSVPSKQEMKEHPYKDISEALLAKGTFMKSKPGEKLNLSKATMISLEQKQLTHITNLDKCPNLLNLHLANNFISKIEGLSQLSKIKMLKLEHNNISKIEGLESLVNLENLYLSSNYIARLENLTHNTRIHELYISKQKINTNFTFDPETTNALAYTLEKLQCNQNKVKNIAALKYLAVVKEVYLTKNDLDDIGELSETINGMSNLRILSFRDNPLTKAQKYRDYIVILSKTLQQLDGKKILAKEREYLVKLYALKHAKQEKQEEKPKMEAEVNKELLVMKFQEERSHQPNINRATDLRGNAPYSNTKHITNNKR